MREIPAVMGVELYRVGLEGKEGELDGMVKKVWRWLYKNTGFTEEGKV